MTTTLYLIRHGETEGGGARRYHGGIDVPLNDKGREQMRRASLFIKGHLRTSALSRYSSYLRDLNSKESARSGSAGLPEFTEQALSAVYSSNLQRALKSAEIVAGSHGLNVVAVPDLRERSFGVWEGMTFAEIRERYPLEFESWAGNPLKYHPVGGESTDEVRDRVVPAIEGTLRGHPGGNIAVVAHGGVNRIILCHFLGMPLENIFRIEQDHGAVNIIEFWEKYPVVKLINGVPYD